MTADHGTIIWFTGLPASGKSTLAHRLRDRLHPRWPTVVLDSDDVRDVVGAEDYGAARRDELYRVLSGLATLLARQGLVVLVAATAPRRAHRELVRAAPVRVLEVWVTTPLEDCERRDVKGLYARARAGDAPTLPGVGVPYEVPLAPDVTATGGFDDAALVTLERLVTEPRSAAS